MANPLADIEARVKEAFVRDRTILSFTEYFKLMQEQPKEQLRSAAQYVKAVFDHFGTEPVQRPYGSYTRYKLFDAPFSNGEGRIAGQEHVQMQIYKILSNFVRVGRINKMVLLHGPNGSAKTSLVSCIVSAMEAYAKLPVGAMYRFNWIFPKERLGKSSLGFGGDGEKAASSETFAHVPPDMIDARVPGELNDHPIFLIPVPERQRLLADMQEKLGPDFVVSDYIRLGELGKKSRTIYDALLQAYNGDFVQVLNHVQVERFYPSKRYSTAAVTIEPQMSVDAEMHQITADRSLAALPKSLANVSLFNLAGPLVDANRGLLEFADLLKRPVETFKYLLGTVETQTVSIGGSIIYLDQLFFSSTNEKYLEAFKQHPDFTSFKGRIELVPVPYLLTLKDEIEIYKPVITAKTVGKPVAPHAIEVAAMWAVLSRLRRPDPHRYVKALTDIVRGLAPVEKLRAYNGEQLPKRLTLTQSKELKRALPDMYYETKGFPIYEGSTGASAREMRTVLLNASYNPRYTSLTAMSVLEEIGELVKLASVYEFLRDEAVDGYHDHSKFVRAVEGELLDTIDEEVRTSMGLTQEGSYEELFTRYVLHVSHWVKKERLLDKHTGRMSEPDEDFMREIEHVIMPKEDDRVDFRKGLIGQIGAASLDAPSEVPAYPALFPKYLKRLEEDFFNRRKKQVHKNKENFMKYFSDLRGELSGKESEQVATMLKNMTQKYGYTVESARETIAFLLSKRYTDE
jgi:serine protein kinase